MILRWEQIWSESLKDRDMHSEVILDVRGWSSQRFGQCLFTWL